MKVAVVELFFMAALLAVGHQFLLRRWGALWRFWLQLHAPRWLPRQVLLGCVVCTFFWVGTLEALVLLPIVSHLAWFAPFVIAVFTQLLTHLDHEAD